MRPKQPEPVAARTTGMTRRPAPARTACQVAGGPFTFGGHRLASLYRPDRKTPNPFIFAKIRMLRLPLALRHAYLDKTEGGRLRG